MKIVHICLAAFYFDNYSYQENLLPFYHKQLGHNVEIIASNLKIDKKGKIYSTRRFEQYNNENNIKVTRLIFKHPFLITKKLKLFKNFYTYLKQSNPDLLFIHGLQFLDVLKVIKFKKKFPNIKIIIDNHADQQNSAKNIISNYILHGIIWKYCAKKLEKFILVFYGVLPTRCDFLKTKYCINKDKIKYLPLGTDDLLISNINMKLFNYKRKLFNDDNFFLIVSGGKFGIDKKEVINLIDAVNEISSKYNVKLVLFGIIKKELKNLIYSHLGTNTSFIGFLNSVETKKLILSADLAIYPGFHSVLWEETVGLGTPALFRYIKGFDHLDIGGNCIFTQQQSKDEYFNILNDILSDNSSLKLMKKNALSFKRKRFYYSNIAKKSLEYFIK
jgi:1,2-diacylglycerol 3-alpha-glucosyltransferase